MDSKIEEAIKRHGEIFHFEYRRVGSTTWHRSPHLARPREEAEDLVARMNAADRTVEYRYVQWDGE